MLKSQPFNFLPHLKILFIILKMFLEFHDIESNITKFHKGQFETDRVRRDRMVEP